MSAVTAACSGKEPRHANADKIYSAHAEKESTTLSSPVSPRMDSLLVSPKYLLQRLDSLQNAGVIGVDTLYSSILFYSEFISCWYKSELEIEMIMCPDIRRIFTNANRFHTFYINNYVDLLKRIEHNSKPDKKALYQKKLAQDISTFIGDINIQTRVITPQTIQKNNVFCPATFSSESEKLFTGSGNEKEIMNAALIYGANPIVKVYDDFKKAETTLVRDMHGLNRKYLDVF